MMSGVVRAADRTLRWLARREISVATMESLRDPWASEPR